MLGQGLPLAGVALQQHAVVHGVPHGSLPPPPAIPGIHMVSMRWCGYTESRHTVGIHIFLANEILENQLAERVVFILESILLLVTFHDCVGLIFNDCAQGCRDYLRFIV